MFQTTCRSVQETTNPTGLVQQPNSSYHFGSAPLFESTIPQHPKLTNVSSCPDFETNNDVFDESSMFQQSPGFLERATSSSSAVSFASTSDFQTPTSGIQLHEVSPDCMNLDFPSELLNQMDKNDRRRIRNNLACRASRQRRKLRKQENERLAAGLETQNQELREKIRQLESECQLTRNNVLRRMSET